MGNPIKLLITQFNGGISEDKRAGWIYHKATGFWTTAQYAITKHFDAFTYPKKLVPWNKTQTPDNYQTQYNIKNFCYAQGNFYGLGDAQTGTASRVNVFLNNGVGTTDSWSTATNGTGTTSNKNTDIFFPYKTYIFTYVNGDRISRFDTAGGAFVETQQAITYTFATQAIPVLHPSDDVAYFFADNLVHKTSDGVTFTTSVLTLPSNQRIVACCAHGNYLAIGCVTTDTYNTRSIVYLWDRDSSLTTLSERVDFGEGTLKHLASLDGKLLGVMDFYLENSLGLRIGKVYIKEAIGQLAQIRNELDLNGAVTRVGSLANTRFVRDNKLYFPMSVPTVNSDDRFGVWVMDSSGRATLSIVEQSIASTAVINAIFATGNVWWIAFGTGGAITRSSYSIADFPTTNTSLYETLIFNGGDSSQTKVPLSATVITEPLPLAGTNVILKYRKDEDTSWTTVFTQTSDTNSLRHTVTQSSGLLPSQFKEIQFRIESYAGAVITGFKFKAENKDDDLT